MLQTMAKLMEKSLHLAEPTHVVHDIDILRGRGARRGAGRGEGKGKGEGEEGE